MSSPERSTTIGQSINLYVSRQASSVRRYILEQTLYALVGWIPSVVGLGLRGALYRILLRMAGWAAIEKDVRLRFADNIHLAHVYFS